MSPTVLHRYVASVPPLYLSCRRCSASANGAGVLLLMVLFHMLLVLLQLPLSLLGLQPPSFIIAPVTPVLAASLLRCPLCYCLATTLPLHCRRYRQRHYRCCCCS